MQPGFGCRQSLPALSAASLACSGTPSFLLSINLSDYCSVPGADPSWGRQEQPAPAQGSLAGNCGLCLEELLQGGQDPEPEPKAEEDQDQRCRSEQWAGCTRREPKAPPNFEAGVWEL